jgi:murein DD-endopeptidase MepM/ murein hydrolase activator NlpD
VASPPAAATGATLLWPAQGQIVAEFQPNGSPRNDGINIAVAAGTPVMAAMEGTVAYAGNELAGFGNLVLIRHSNGWVTAYAHNEELLVSRGDTVTRGQVIARAGQTGNVSQPQVHFELRQGTQAVDPMPYLGGTG